MLLFGIFFRSCDPYALAAAAVLSILLQFLSIARVSRDHKLGPHSRKSLNLEGVDDSAVKKTAGIWKWSSNCFKLRRKLAGICGASPAATQHDWTWVMDCGSVPVHQPQLQH